jgi:PAS domain S-box-containing protein
MQMKPPSSPHTAKRSSRAQAELRELADKANPRPMMTELYRNAEAQLRKQKKTSAAGGAKSDTDAQRLLHELQVHQVELEMQNAELQESRNRMEVLLEKFTDLYDFSPVGYFTLAANGNIRQVNLTGAHLVGVERSRLVGQSFGLLVSAAQRPAFNAFLKQVFADQTSRSMDVELVNQGQPLRIIRIRAQRSPAGEACRAVVVDITELNREMGKVRVSEIRYRRLFEAAHDGVLILDPGTRKITDANPFMTKLLDYPREQLVGKELFEIGLLKDEAASQEMFQKLKRNHEVRYEDLPLESKKGRHQEVEVVASLYQEAGHSVIQCNIRDITERKKTEQELAEKARLLDLSNDAIIVRDIAGYIRFWNRGAEELYGWSRQEALGKSTLHFLQTKFFIPLKEMIKELYATDRWVGELSHVKRNGQRITLLARKTLDRDRQGRPMLVLETLTDITERKAAEETRHRLGVLTASNEKLQREIIRRQAVEVSLKQSEQHQRRLLDQSQLMQEELRLLSRQVMQAQEEERKRISRELHDVIAQTLTGINLRLATLKKVAGRDTKGFDRNITRTQRLVEHSVNLVHQFARELRPAVLDDLGLIPALHSFVKLFSQRTRIHVHLKVYAGVERLDGNIRTVLYRVAQEALTNVARHAQASQVEVSILKRAGAVCMKIQDNGKSFNQEHIANTKGRKRLGLLGMRERLEMVAGSFAIESAPGHGTAIIARIPLAKRGGGQENLPANSAEIKT